MEILVVGGGVIGLSIALDLLLAGHKVKVFIRDKNEPASLVAGGMLAPFSEELEGDFLRFSVESLKLWHEYIDRVKDISKRNVFFSEGILRVALDEKEEEELRKRVKVYSSEFCQNLVSYEPQELKREFPYISEKVRYAVLYGDEGNVDTEELMEALTKAVENLGGEILYEDIVRVQKSGDSIERIYSIFDDYFGDFYVFSTGAWLKEHFDFPVFPVKGQILKIDYPIKDYVIYSSKAYIIPKEKDILIGATSEDKGFDKSKTLGGIKDLASGAIEVRPSLEDAQILDIKVGFRPGTPGGMPIFYYGENYAVFSGHYRNGILLAPITAKVALKLIDKGEVSEYFQKFSPYRFR